MTASGAKEFFHWITQNYFRGYTVIFANQSRATKPKEPLITILPGNVHRHQAAIETIDNGIIIGHYESRLNFTVDLFTNGKPIEDNKGEVVAYENSAMDELLGYCNYLNSPKCINTCHEYDVSILIEADAQDLTGVVNDNNYEYRARQEIELTFTQETNTIIGDMGSFKEVSIEEIPYEYGPAKNK